MDAFYVVILPNFCLILKKYFSKPLYESEARIMTSVIVEIYNRILIRMGFSEWRYLPVKYRIKNKGNL